MTWFVALGVAQSQETAERIQDSLQSLSPAPEATVSVEIDESRGVWEAGGYFRQSPDRIGLALLASVYGIDDFSVCEISEHDWVQEISRNLPPVRAGRFLVYGSHCEINAGPAELPILIDASLAFGTGHHASTQLCLELMSQLFESGARISRCADIGCGTGILSIAAALLWRCRVECCDSDPTAVTVAELNISANHVAEHINVHAVSGAPSALFPVGTYDLVVANILSEPLIRVAPELTSLLSIQGQIILSGLTAEHAEEVLAAYCPCGLRQVRQQQQGNWVALHLLQDRSGTTGLTSTKS